MAMLGTGLAAQQHRRNFEDISIQGLLDPALPQEFEECPLVVGPSAAISVGVEDLACRGQAGLMDVLRIAEPLQEERKVSATGESGETGCVVQPYVEETLDAGILQRPEELGRRLLRETDRIDFRGLTSVSGNRTGWPPSISPSMCMLPSPLMCRSVIPRSSKARPTSNLRWQRVGSSSLHSRATVLVLISCSSLFIPSRNSRDLSTRA